MKNSIYQEPRIVMEPARIIAGLSIETCLKENKSRELWHAFHSLKKSIKCQKTDGSYNIQQYHHDFLRDPFLPTTIFTRWAGVEVNNSEAIPTGLKQLEIPEGKWAVFSYVGTAKEFGIFANYIYSQWLPNSNYTLAERPHYEYLPANYPGPEDPTAEEEVWIPIK